MLLETINNVFETNKPPKQWTTNIIIPIHKKGNILDVENYRGISLMSTSAKIYNRIILNRLYPTVDTLVRLNQTGFRTNMCTTEHIDTLQRIIEGANSYQLP